MSTLLKRNDEKVMDASLGSILGDFLKIDGVKSAAVVGRDGFVIDSVESEKVDMEALGAMVAIAVGSAEKLGSEFELGTMEQYLVEYEHGKVAIATIGENILALVTDNSAVIGGVRFAVKRSIQSLSNIM